jgi:hypothetical protein
MKISRDYLDLLAKPPPKKPPAPSVRRRRYVTRAQASCAGPHD